MGLENSILVDNEGCLGCEITDLYNYWAKEIYSSLNKIDESINYQTAREIVDSGWKATDAYPGWASYLRDYLIERPRTYDRFGNPLSEAVLQNEAVTKSYLFW